MSVFYLKYRPKKIGELDSDSVRVSLQKILSGKDIPQSFLFAGPKGSGKTSAARIVAKSVNCVEVKNGEPCGKCDNCLEIDRGSSMDVMELDAASNRGIDDVRELRDKAYLLPSKLKKKVFIIDEVHMLTKEAFNALLKLIEEPPAHTLFITCTTDPEKIPDTVLSRLIRIDFKKGNFAEVESALKRAAEGEGLKLDEKILKLIFERSEGSFRNAQKILTELFLELGKNFGSKEVKEWFDGRTGGYGSADLEDDLWKKDTKKILQKMEEMADNGMDFKQYREKLIRYFQNQLLANWGLGVGREGWKRQDLVRWLNLLIAAGKLEKDTNMEQLPLQLAVVEFLIDAEKEDRVIKEEKTELTEVKQETKKEGKEKIIEKMPEVVEVGDFQLEMARVENEWGKVLQVVKPFNHSVEAFLRAARPKILRGNCLVVEVFYPFHKEKLEELKNRSIVEEGLMRVFATKIRFECVLSKGRKKALEIGNDTPMDQVSDNLVNNGEKSIEDKKDLYDVAKEIFG